MKRFIKIILIAAMLLAAVVYGMRNLGYLSSGNAPRGQVQSEETEAGAGKASEAGAYGSDTETGDSESESGTYAVETGTYGTEAVPASEAPHVMVHVCGCVASPGVYGLSEDARIYEAVEAAGGFTEQADEEYINLASYVSDGMKIYIPSKDEAAASEGSAGTGYIQAAGGSATADGKSAAGAGEKIDINSADEAALQTLPGIGPSRASDIVAYRKKNGAFSTIEDIMKVPGIKEAAFSKIKDKIVAR